MRKVKSLFMMLVFAFAVASCTEKEVQEPVVPSIELKSTEVSISSEDMQFAVEYSSNVDFTIETSEWITPPQSNTSPLIFTVSPYDEIEPRKGEIVFLTEGKQLNKIAVIQTGKPANMEIGQTFYNVGDDASSITLTVTANFSYTYEHPDWISVEKTKSTTVNEIVISWLANTEEEPREGKVEFIKTDNNEKFSTVTITQEGHVKALRGFYHANEGTWGANNASLDYYSFTTNTITNKWWLSLNSGVRGGLGDVANDVLAYEDYLLIVVNTSNILEICNRDGKHLGEVEIPNCRKVVAYGDYAYVSSYAGNASAGTADGPGYISKVSLKEMKEVAQCEVGDQPEGMFIADDCLYVANTFGYTYPQPTATISKIELSDFENSECSFAVTGTNPYGAFKLLPDGKHFFVAWSGNYSDIPASCSIYDLENMWEVRHFDFAGTYADVCDGKLYIMGSSFSWMTYDWEYNNYIYDPATDTLMDLPLGEDVFTSYGAPTGIWVNPVNKDIYIADQGDYVSPAYIYHYDSTGREIERLNVGVCPGHLAWDWR